MSNELLNSQTSQLSLENQNEDNNIENGYEELPDTPDTPILSDDSDVTEERQFPFLWGTLVAVDTEMNHAELVNNEYTFGREGSNLDFILQHTAVDGDHFSKKHFTVGYCIRTKEAYIINNSKNGTYVDGEKLPPNDYRRHLQHLNRISVIDKKNEVFIFLDEFKYKQNRSRLSKQLLNKYFICDSLGQGCFGTVRLCIHKETKYEFAMKEVQNDTENLKYISREINNMKNISHPNIVTFHEAIENLDTVYIMLEYVPGENLRSIIQNRGKLDEPLTRSIVYQIALALRYLHNLNIVHRDLKPANILIEHKDNQVFRKELRVKLCDFGLSKNTDQSNLKSKVGTPLFVAPEVLFDNPYDKKVDVWSLGVILYHCLSGQYPFKDPCQFTLFLESLKRGVTFGNRTWSHPSADVKNLILRMTNFKVKERCNIDDVLSHPWIVKEYGAPWESELFTGVNGTKASAMIADLDGKRSIDTITDIDNTRSIVMMNDLEQ